MRTKAQSIELLINVISGKAPKSSLKENIMTYLHCLSTEQRTRITNKIGGVHISNCSQYFPNEPLYGLWNNIPIGFTAAFSLGCFDYPDSSVNLIDCRDAVAFDEFLKGLPQKQLKVSC